jgi:hypothetical protein
MPNASQFSGGYKRLWSANNCTGTAKLCGRVPSVIVGVWCDREHRDSGTFSLVDAALAKDRRADPIWGPLDRGEVDKPLS